MITAPATPAATSTRKTTDTASSSQSTDDVPTDLFQDLMQALSVVPDDTIPADTGSALPLSEGLSIPAQEPVPPPDFLGLGLVLPQVIPLLPTARDTAQGQPLPSVNGDNTASASPMSLASGPEARSPTHALLDLVRGHAHSPETSLPAAMTTLAAAATTPRPAPEAGAASLMAVPEPAASKAAKPGLVSTLDTTAQAQDTPLAEPFQPTMPAAVDLGGGFRQAVSHAAAESAGVYKNTLQTQPSSPTFPAELVSEVRFLVKGGLQHAELRMNPAELGPIQIELRVSSQVADIGFTATHAATREGITQSLPQLREMLNSQGLSLGQTSVGAEAQGQQQAAQDRPRFDASPRTVEGRTAATTIDMRVGSSPRRAQGVLDLYA